MSTADIIARYIQDMLDRSDGTAELQRSVLAHHFHCVPSQINYVLSTRFSPERGYAVESRRGGGGYIRVSRIGAGSPDELIMETVNRIGESLSPRSAGAYLSRAVEAGALTAREARLIFAALGDNALRPVPREFRDIVRAPLMKYMLLESISD